MKKILALSILALASVAMAKPYADAGCGLGTYVFGTTNDTASQVMAATTNSTGVQTFGITSGTSNCVDNGAVKGAKAVPMFIEVNSAALAKDAARGQGETLAGLANLMGCDAKALGPALQSNYKSIFVDTQMQPSAIETGINHVVSSNHQACGA